MIKIGICDEDAQFVNTLHHIINTVMFSIDQWEACIFHSPKELLSALQKENFDCQLIFMDILAKKGSAMEAVQYIYENQIDTDLIFVTASTEHVFECYHYHTFAYLLKPISENDISFELQRYIRELTNSSRFLSISVSGVKHQIPISSILYIESNRRKVTIHTTQSDYECYQKLDDMEKQLSDAGFIRCHQSYLVSSRHIIECTTNQLTIAENNIPISRRYQPQIKERFTTNQTNNTFRPSICKNQKNFGGLVCIKGSYLGSITRIRPEQTILIGRDGNQADMIINLPYISRIHCSLIYHYDTMTYELIDYSNNGIYVNLNKRLLKGETYLLKSGTEICFGNAENIYKLL